MKTQQAEQREALRASLQNLFVTVNQLEQSSDFQSVLDALETKEKLCGVATGDGVVGCSADDKTSTAGAKSSCVS